MEPCLEVKFFLGSFLKPYGFFIFLQFTFAYCDFILWGIGHNPECRPFVYKHLSWHIRQGEKSHSKLAQNMPTRKKITRSLWHQNIRKRKKGLGEVIASICLKSSYYCLCTVKRCIKINA